MAENTRDQGVEWKAAPTGCRRKAPPAPPSTIPKSAKIFAGKALDLDALRTTVVEAAGVSTGLWFSYIFVLLYLFIAVGSVTHKDLFLQSPIRLPFLNIELPLLGFFFLSPVLFLIVHGYVLLHFVLLAGKVGAFHTQLERQLKMAPDVRTDLRRQLPSNLFVQILAGPREIRNGSVGTLLQLIAWISLVIGPVALLLFFLLQFLPFHHPWITWWHRIVIIAELALLWLLGPSITLGRRVKRHSLFTLLRRSRSAQVIAGMSAAVLVLAFPVATYPGETLHKLPIVRFIPTGVDGMSWDFENFRWKSPYELLIDGKIDWAAREPKSLWSNRIVLPGFDVIDHGKFDTEAKFATLPETVSLRKRNLDGAVLIGATLRKSDLTAASLIGAQLTEADLREAKLDCAQVEEDCVQLQGASLNRAQLQGASLGGAQLQGAFLGGTQLQGAFLGGAQLQGAFLDGAHLQGALLGGAQLQGASLDQAQLQGASLSETQLQSASLNQAQLQGAILDRAQLQGASFDRAQLQGASLKGVSVWRANIREAVSGPTFVTASSEAMTRESFESLKADIQKAMHEGEARKQTIQIIDTTLNPNNAIEGEAARDEAWRALEAAPLDPNAFMKTIAAQWRVIGCDAAGAPFILRKFVKRMDIHFIGGINNVYIASDAHRGQSISGNANLPFIKRALVELTQTFLQPDCVGANGLTESDRAALRARAQAGWEVERP